jgi:hypothetical protein
LPDGARIEYVTGCGRFCHSGSDAHVGSQLSACCRAAALIGMPTYSPTSTPGSPRSGCSSMVPVWPDHIPRMSITGPVATVADCASAGAETMSAAATSHTCRI